MKRFVAVLLAAMLILTAFAGCSSKESPVALKIGSMEFTVEDVNYMYVTSFNDLYNNLYYYYGDYLSSIIDITKPLEEQMIDETTTWHQYVLDYAVNTLKSFTGIYEKAVEAGYVLNEEYQADLDTLEEQLDSVAESSGMTRDEYLFYMYGEDVSLETVKKMTEFRYIVSAYAEEYEAGIEVSEEDINAYYEANKLALDTITFRYYTSYYEEAAEETTEEVTEEATEEAAEETTEEVTEEATEEAAEETTEEATEETTEEATEETAEEEKTLTQEEAEAQANVLASVHTAEEFNALAYEYTTKESQKKLFDYGDATRFGGAGYDAIGIEEVTEWLFDEARVQGDTMVHHDVDYKSYLTVMFEERVTPDYDCVDVRHILIAVEEDENGIISDEEWERAKAEAEEVLNTYLAGEQTGEAFGNLAKEHSADSSASAGGLYENVTKGKMVSNFDNWCFDSARKTGDTEIIITPYGMHVMYFEGIGDNYLEIAVRPVIAEEKFNTWVADSVVNLTEEKTAEFENAGGMIDDIVTAAGEAGAENETGDDGSKTGVIIAMLVVVIIVCVFIIIKKKTEKPAEEAAEEETASEESESEETEETELPEATDEDLTEEELLAEEAFEESVPEEETAEETSEEETSEE